MPHERCIICLQQCVIFWVNVDTYSSTMEHMGIYNCDTEDAEKKYVSLYHYFNGILYGSMFFGGYYIIAIVELDMDRYGLFTEYTYETNIFLMIFSSSSTTSLVLVQYTVMYCTVTYCSVMKCNVNIM